MNDRIKVNGGKAGVHPDIEVKQDGKTKVIVAGGKTEFSKRSLKVPGCRTLLGVSDRALQAV